MRKINNMFKMVSLIFFLFLAITTMAMALDYPTKQIQIVVPYPPGGTLDVTARIMAPKLGSILGQPVIVINKGGGGGAIGIKYTAMAEPDGYTILYCARAMVLLPILTPGVGFKLEDFTPICSALSLVYFINVKADAPWRTFGDLIKEAKKNPGKFTFSTPGHASGPHLIGEHFKIETGTDIVHVPMANEAAAVTAVLGSHVDLVFSPVGAVKAHLKAGTLRALALMSPKRIKDFPDIPTTTELGYPSLTPSGSTWYAFFSPAKTPKEIVEKIAKAFQTALKDKEVISNLEKLDMLVGGDMTLEETAKFFQEEDNRWREVAKKAKMVEGTRK